MMVEASFLAAKGVSRMMESMNFTLGRPSDLGHRDHCLFKEKRTRAGNGKVVHTTSK
jgi:hypothetical protein